MRYFIGYIYTLSDSSGIKYIGKTKKRLECRLKEHIYYSTKSTKDKSHKSNWINKLYKTGKIDELKITSIHGVYDLKEMSDLEIKYIKEYRENGCKLTNLTDGGDGITMTDEIRKKISISKIGTPSWNKGKKMSKECIMKMSASRIGNKPSEISRQKMRDAKTGGKHFFYGKNHKPSSIHKMKLSHLGEKRKNSSSKHCGIYFIKSKNKWLAQININSKKKTIGLFNNEMEAIEQYKKYKKCISI